VIYDKQSFVENIKMTSIVKQNAICALVRKPVTQSKRTSSHGYRAVRAQKKNLGLDLGKSKAFRTTTAIPRRVVTTAAVDSSVAIAIAQQQFGLAIVLGGEGAFSYFDNEEGTKGRPEVASIGPLIGGAILTGILINTGVEFVTPAALVAGLGLDAYAGYVCYQRFVATEMDPLDWPGAKVWPGVSLLACFLVFSAMGQGLVSLVGS